MNPYLSPFTMPDGSTRRSIVERVPECLYTEAHEGGGYLRRGWIDDRWGEQWFICAPDNVPASCRLLSEASALALCRVACEDWMIETCQNFGIDIDPKDGTLRVLAWHMGRRYEGRGEIHHALNAAAHAVADAKGVPA